MILCLQDLYHNFNPNGNKAQQAPKFREITLNHNFPVLRSPAVFYSAIILLSRPLSQHCLMLIKQSDVCNEINRHWP